MKQEENTKAEVQKALSSKAVETEKKQDKPQKVAKSSSLETIKVIKTPKTTKTIKTSNKNAKSSKTTKPPPISEDLTSLQITSFEKLLKTNLKRPDPKFEKLFKILLNNSTSTGFRKIIQHLKESYEEERKKLPAEKVTQAPPAEKPTASVVSKEGGSTEENIPLKSLFVGKSAESKQKKQDCNEKRALGFKPSEPTVMKLENCINEILKTSKAYSAKASREEAARKTLDSEKSEKSERAECNESPSCTETIKSGVDSTTATEANNPTIITIKKYTENMGLSRSEMSTDTINSSMRKTQMSESAVQTDRYKKRRLIPKVTQTDIEALLGKPAVAMETQTDISIHKHAQIKFSGTSMQLSKNVTITNVRKNVINVRNICEETSEAVKRLLEREAILQEDDLLLKQTMSVDLRKGKHKAEILGQIKNTLENVIDRFKKSTMLINKASNFADMSANLKKVTVPPKPPVFQKVLPSTTVCSS